MLPIKFFKGLVGLSIVCVLLFSSCSISETKAYSEVDFTKTQNVQITYKQNVYNSRVTYSQGFLTISILDNASALDGIKYRINSDICEVSYLDVLHTFSTLKLPGGYLPVVLYGFIFDFSGVVVTESYDSDKNCLYVRRSVSDNFVTLEVYEHQNNVSYCINIT